MTLQRGRMITRRAALAGVGAGGALRLLPGRAAAAAGRDSLIYGLSAYPPNLRPWESTGAAAGTVKMMLYRGLVGYDAQGRLAPELAAGWSVEGDRTTVFKLRPDAVFHNGERVTSADVKHSLTAMMAPGSTAFLRSDLAIVDRIDTPDDLTVRLVLKQPSATLPFSLASYNGGIVSAASPPDQPIGAGPFTLAAQERGTRVRVERFAKFYKPGRPAVPAIDFVAYADENLRVAALQSGDVDIIEYVPAPSMDAIGRNPALSLLGGPGPFMDLLFNVTRPPFNDPKVRHALGFAVNSDDIVQAAFGGKGDPLLGIPLPGGTPFAHAVPGTTWSFDPARAKALLAAAGYPNGFSTTLLATSQYSMHRDTAQVLQQQLAAVGVTADLKLPDWPTRVALGSKGQYEIAIHGTSGDYNDPDSLTPLIGSGPDNYSKSFGFRSDRIEQLLRAGRAELDEAKRVAIYDDLQRAFFDEVPLLGLCWRTQSFGTRKSVKGFAALPGFLVFASFYTLEDVTFA